MYRSYNQFIQFCWLLQFVLGQVSLQISDFCLSDIDRKFLIAGVTGSCLVFAVVLVGWLLSFCSCMMGCLGLVILSFFRDFWFRFSQSFSLFCVIGVALGFSAVDC